MLVISVVWIGQVLYFDDYNFHDGFRKYIGGSLSDETEIGYDYWEDIRYEVMNGRIDEAWYKQKELTKYDRVVLEDCKKA